MEAVANLESHPNRTDNPALGPSAQNPLSGEHHIQTINSSPHFEDIDRELAATNSLERTTTPTTPTTPNNSPIKHMGHRDSSWLEIDVCREFLRGECSRSAEECRFAHPTGSVVVKDGFKVTCCFDFLKVCVCVYHKLIMY